MDRDRAIRYAVIAWCTAIAFFANAFGQQIAAAAFAALGLVCAVVSLFYDWKRS